MSPLEHQDRTARSDRSTAAHVLGRVDPVHRDAAALAARWMEPADRADSAGEGRTRADEMRAELAAIRAGERGPGPHALDLRGISLCGADLSGLDLTGSQLSGADLSRADLSNAILFRGELVETNLYQARLDGVEMSGADLTGSNLQSAHAHAAGFGSARLVGASLVMAQMQEATFSEADLERADLKMACLQGARLREANLQHTDLTRTDLREADLTSAQVEHASLFGADLRAASVCGVRGYQSASWIQADVRDVDFNHAHLCRRFILDQNYIEEFKNQSPYSRAVYFVWWLTSDCGRSLLRWSVLTVVIALLFAGIYSTVELDWGGNRHPISAIYFSVVTLTTLGYGDIVPSSPAAQVICMVEVFTGYMMLGGLLSIFSNKMARRAE